MLVERNISVWTFCPHHILPCHFIVNIGYIPKKEVLGLSKFTRIAIALGKRPVIQEQYTQEVADVLYDSLKPEGLGVYVIGSHGCMACRGVEQPEVDVTTCVLKGSFLTDGTVRKEFYDNILRRTNG